MVTQDVLSTKRRDPSPELKQPPDLSPRAGHRPWVWLLILAALLLGTFIYYRSRASAASKAAAARAQAGPPAVSVSVFPVQKRDVPFYLNGLGSVTAFNTVTVRSRVDGQLLKVYFREGQFVHAGDLLAEIDPRPYRVALDQAQGQLARDQAQLNDAKLNLNRYTQLVQEGVFAQQQLDTQRATVGGLNGAIQADQAQIDNQKLNLTYCRIAAPISGRVGLRLVDVGNMVHATDPNGMLVITQVQPIAVVFTIPEDNLQEVASQMGKRELQVEAYDRDNTKKLADGKLLMIDNQIDPTTGTVKLKSVFDNRDLSLWPNQFVNVRLALSVRKDAMVVSAAAIQKGTQGSFVYVIEPDSTAEVRPVQVDFVEGNIAVIRQGLQQGEQVVVDGQDKLQSGTKVDLHPGIPAAGRSQSSSAQQSP